MLSCVVGCCGDSKPHREFSLFGRRARNDAPNCGAEARGYLVGVEREVALMGELAMLRSQLDRTQKGLPLDHAAERATECESLAMGGKAIPVEPATISPRRTSG